MVVLDTNIIIDHLWQAHGTETVLEKVVRMRAKDALAISTITIQELYEGTSTREVEKEKNLLAPDFCR